MPSSTDIIPLTIFYNDKNKYMVKQEYKDILDNFYKKLSKHNISCKMAVHRDGEIEICLGDSINDDELLNKIYKISETLELPSHGLDGGAYFSGCCMSATIFDRGFEDNSDYSNFYFLTVKSKDTFSIIKEVFNKHLSEIEDENVKKILKKIKKELKQNLI